MKIGIDHEWSWYEWDTAQEFNSLLFTYPYNARSILHGYFNPLVFWY